MKSWLRRRLCYYFHFSWQAEAQASACIECRRCGEQWTLQEFVS